MSDFAYDLFVSYAQADHAWAEGYLLDALQAAGVRVLIREDFRLGAYTVEEFQRAVEQSRRTLLVLSPDYLSEHYNRYAGALAESQAVRTGAPALIPLVLRPVELPLGLTAREALDATDPAGWKDVVERLCAELQRPLPGPPSRLPCPYPGMRPFKAEHAGVFHGRDDEIEELCRRLRHQRYLWIVGPSGSGKSSLIFAGLVPRLHERQPDHWLLRDMRPGSEPLDALAGALAVQGDPKAADWAAAVETLLAGPAPAQRLLLVVDQFEEVFAQASQQDQDVFFAALRALRQVQPCTLLLALRADFQHDWMNSRLWTVPPPERLEITPLRGEALRQAITLPARRQGVYLEAGLADLLLTDAAEEPGVLPLLQETMAQLWEQMERRLLPLRAYERPGRDGRSGLAVAVSTRADAALGELSPEQVAMAGRILVRLVQFGEGRADTRRQQPVTDLRAAGDDPALFAATLDHLANNRLLTLSGEQGTPGRRADLAHEALIKGWPTLDLWLSQRRESEHKRRRLEGKAAEWLRLGGGRGALLDEVELPEAERWLEGPDAADLGYSEALQDLVAASRARLDEAEREREAARQRELTAQMEARQAREQAAADAITAGKLRRRAVALGLALLLALIAAGVAGWLFSDARTARQFADEQRHSAQVAATGEALAGQTALADSLARATAEAMALAQQAGAETAAAAEAAARQTAEVAATAESEARQAVEIEKKNVEKAKRVADAGELAAFALIELEQREDPSFSRALLLGRQAVLTTWQPDGSVEPVALAALNRAVAAAPPWLATLRVDGGRIESVAFSPDGTRVATAGDDATVRVWLVAANPVGRGWRGEQILQLAGHTGTVRSVAFSPDGDQLVTAGDDGTARLWRLPSGPAGDAASGQELLHLTGHTDRVNSAAFGPGGQHIVTAGADGTARVWRLASSPAGDAWSAEEQLQLTGHTASVTSAAFGPGGDRILTASEDGTARVWRLSSSTAGDLTGASEQIQLAGPAAPFYSAAFSPDGELIVTTSFDAARVWHAESGEELQISVQTFQGGSTFFIPSRVSSAAFSPDGGRIVTTNWDGTARVWRLASGPAGDPWSAEELLQLTGHTDAQVTSAAWSPDGQRVVTAGWDGTARLWDVTSGGELLQLAGHRASVLTAAFGPSGEQIVTAGVDGTSRLWDVATGRELLQLTGHWLAVNSAAFGPDGQRIVTAGVDGTARVWQIASTPAGDAWYGEEVLQLTGHERDVLSAAFSPGGGHIVTASYDNTARVWNAASGEELLQLTGHTLPLFTAAFSSDGKRIVTASNDNTVRIWELASGPAGRADAAEEVLQLTGHTEGVVSAAFGPDDQRIVTASYDGTARVWHAGSGQELLELVGHIGSVTSAAFSPNGQRIVTAGSDGTARLWHAQTGQELLRFTGHTNWVVSVAFSPDGRRIVTSSDDGTARTWLADVEELLDLAASLVQRDPPEFTPDERCRFLHECD